MAEREFLRPRLRGARFKGGVIPLEVLRDLAVLEEMLIEVAKWKFLEANNGRRRTPRGFGDKVELKLVGIEDGSAIPVLAIAFAGAYLPNMDPMLPHFEAARDAIVAAIGAAEQKATVAGYLPEKTLAYFDRFGRSLRDGESMEFQTPAHPAVARLTKESRRRLVLAAPSAQGLTEDVTQRGLIPEADQEAMTFHLLLSDGRKVKARMEGQVTEAVLEAFNGFRSGVRVAVKGVGKFDRQNHLQGLESVEHVTVLDPLDVPARLDELRTLKDGWLDGKGFAPRAAGLDWLATAFEQHYPGDLALPRLFPTAEGGIQAEWSLSTQELSLEIDIQRRMAEWHSLDVQSGADAERPLNLDCGEDWQWLAGEIRRTPGGVA